MAAHIPNESGLVSFAGAAAGHDGVLTDSSGALLIKPCHENESSFYESAVTNYPKFGQLMPVFYGKLALSTTADKDKLRMQDPMSINAALQAQEATAQELISSANTKQTVAEAQQVFGKKLDTDHAVVLENITAGFERPNTLDVKLGARLWDDGTPPAKRQRLDEVSANSTSSSLGFRIAGMRVWQPKEDANTGEPQGQYKVFDKYYGRKFSDNNVRSGFEEFFLEGTSKKKLTPLRRAVLELCEAEVTQMQQVLEKLESRMYSASILFVYEGDNQSLDKAIKAVEELQKGQDTRQTEEEEEEEEDEEQGSDDADSKDDDDVPKIHAAKLIDFAHAHWTPEQGPDENMLLGVRNVKRILRQMLDS